MSFHMKSVVCVSSPEDRYYVSFQICGSYFDVKWMFFTVQPFLCNKRLFHINCKTRQILENLI